MKLVTTLRMDFDVQMNHLRGAQPRPVPVERAHTENRIPSVTHIEAALIVCTDPVHPDKKLLLASSYRALLWSLVSFLSSVILTQVEIKIYSTFF